MNEPMMKTNQTEYDKAHRIGTEIYKKSFEIIGTDGLRKEVVDLSEIISQFDKEGIDIVPENEF